MALSAYKQTISQTENPRQIERRIMTRITSALSAHQESFDEGNRVDRLGVLSGGLREALSENQNLWSKLKVDLLSPTNKMPTELRSSLISMAIFVERHTAGVLAGEGGVGPLVDINQAMIGGLSGVSGEVA